ncbi:hypothetical protein ACR6C2_30325 [Streptomyces sp. INA 01156]
MARPGTLLLAVALLALVAWLTTYDVARRTLRSTGLPRFSAACLLAGYAWLGLAGALWLLDGPIADGPRYDALVHCVFLGFVISMIMAHAPVILPAVLRRPLPYRPVLAVPPGCCTSRWRCASSSVTCATPPRPGGWAGPQHRRRPAVRRDGGGPSLTAGAAPRTEPRPAEKQAQ